MLHSTVSDSGVNPAADNCLVISDTAVKRRRRGAQKLAELSVEIILVHKACLLSLILRGRPVVPNKFNVDNTAPDNPALLIQP